MHGVVVLNKIDLVDDRSAADRPAAIYRQCGYTVVLTSAVDGSGIDELREIVRLKTSIFCGHSGVGKSTLLNILEPSRRIATRAVSTATDRGAHTTSSVELHPLSVGGYIADMPGLRVIGLWGLKADELPTLYPEFAPYLGQCRFNDCLHLGEPGCAILAAIEQGTIGRERYDGFLRIRKSLVG